MQPAELSQTTERVRAIINQLAPSPTAECHAAQRLVDDLGYNSLALLEMAFALEDEFGLDPIDRATAEGIKLVSDVESLVTSQLRARA